MRKHQQRQILELLETIREAQEAELWLDCQTCAITAGEFIESLEGEGTQTVALLEEYCDLLYEAHAGEQRGRALRKALISIENSVRQELKPNRVEMAFLSYKAAMSDSLESIYLAAKADPSCDAYWIPIPYIERNTDQVTGTELYEGPEFYGSNIECTWWEDYNIEQRHPDVIFTFYPYDEDNYLTGVRPGYQCEQLRKHTDMLVYVPYFVVSDTARMIEEHCTTSGCIFAHKVIVQAEEVRHFYIKSFRKLYGNDLGKPEDRFIALGSPKFDKVINSRREDYELPDDWARLIGGKKVVLYNTSVSAQLNHDDAYLEKLRTVLAMFKARDDVVVWWRPHPLMERTYAAMRPWLVDRYKILVAQYRSEGWGIYDDSSDVHRAIAWSDAYYGDGGSLVALYAVTGRPVYMQHPDVSLEISRQDRLMFECSYDDGDYVWFAPFFGNALYKLSKKTWVAEYVGKFPDEPKDSFRLYSDIAEYEGKLYFAPYSAKKIAVYDMATSNFTMIEVKEPTKRNPIIYDKNYKIAKTVRSGEYVYLLPGTYPAIIRVDTQTDETMYFTDWLEPLEKIKNEDTWYFYGATVVDGKVYVSSRCANAVLIIDGVKCEIKSLGDDGINYNGVCYDGTEFWLVPTKMEQGLPSLIKWNEPAMQTEVLCLMQKKDCAELCYVELEDKVCVVLGVMHHSGYIWVFPHHLPYSLKIRAATGDVLRAEEFQTECDVKADPVIFQTYTSFWEKDGVIYAMGARSGAISQYDTATEVFSVNTMTEECHIRLAEELDIINPGTAGESIYHNVIQDLGGDVCVK